MSLPIITLDQDQRWDCHQCGFCCRGSWIPLSPSDIERITSQNWQEDPDYRNVRIMLPNRSASSPSRLAHRRDGSCVFLGNDGLCRIHAKFGFDAKPTVCQTFPLQLVPRDKQVVLTLRRACPSAADDRGRPLSEHLPFVHRLVRQEQLRAEPIAPPMLKSGEVRDWKTTRAVLSAADSLLQDNRFPPVRRLVHVLQFAGLLEKAQTKGLNDSKLIELARTLADLAPEESKPFFSEKQPPRGYSKILFRLAAVDCARLHPSCRHGQHRFGRLRLARVAWQVIRGKVTPSVDAFFPAVPIVELEKPAGLLGPEIYRPLTRYFETTSASSLYAIADRQSWSVVESLRGFALLFPVGLWLLRWIGHDREVTAEDMIHIVVALDRSQGYASLSGQLHRSRLRTLAASGELERLVVWYAQ